MYANRIHNPNITLSNNFGNAIFEHLISQAHLLSHQIVSYEETKLFGRWKQLPVKIKQRGKKRQKFRWRRVQNYKLLNLNTILMWKRKNRAAA